MKYARFIRLWLFCFLTATPLWVQAEPEYRPIRDDSDYRLEVNTDDVEVTNDSEGIQVSFDYKLMPKRSAEQVGIPNRPDLYLVKVQVSCEHKRINVLQFQAFVKSVLVYTSPYPMISSSGLDIKSPNSDIMNLVCLFVQRLKDVQDETETPAGKI